MAQCKQETGTHKFVTLCVKEGFGFGYLKHNLLRILAGFENKVLSSEYKYITPAPFLNCNFTWRVENKLLKRLQSNRVNITIELKISEDGKEEHTAGFATIEVRHAEFVTGCDSPRCRSLELQGTTRPFGVRKPQLFVSLTVQAIACAKAIEECHSAELLDSEDVSEPNRNICDSCTHQEDCYNIKKSAFLNKYKPVEETESYYDESTRTESLYPDTTERRQHVFINKYRQSSATTLKTIPSITNSTRTSEAKNPKLKTEQHSSKPHKDRVIDTDSKNTNDLKDYTNYTEDKSSIGTKCILNKSRSNGSETNHLYKLELHIQSTEWFKTLKNTKVLIKFYNPYYNSIVTIKKQDYYLPDLLLCDIICSMYYVCLSEELLETVMYYPPQILIYKANNHRLVAKGTLKLTNLKNRSQSEYFETCIPLVEKNYEIIGEVHVLIKFQDLGITSKISKAETLECVIEFKEHFNEKGTKQDTSVGDVISDLENLSAIHEKLRTTYNKMSSCFQKMENAHAAELESKGEQSTLHKEAKQSKEKAISVLTDERPTHGTHKKPKLHQEKTERFQEEIPQAVPHIKPSNVETIKSQAKESVSDGNILKASEKILWCDFCRQFHLVKKASNYITAIETVDPKQRKSKEVSFSQTTGTKSSNLQKQHGIQRESYVKPAHVQHEVDSKKKIRDSNQNARSVKPAGVQTTKPTIPYKPRQMAHVPKPPITVIKTPCQGCERYLEVGYGKHVWQDDELTFWCKDCSIKKLQSELKETMENCTAEIVSLKTQIKNLEDDYALFAATSISKEKYDYLRAAQHNLSMLCIHAEEQNEYLHLQCYRAAEQLEKFKKQEAKEMPFDIFYQNEYQFYKDEEQLKDVHVRVNELKQEIDNYRHKDDTVKQPNENVEEKLAPFQKPTKKSEQKFTSRKDRCEACRIIQNQKANTAAIKKTKTSHSSVPQQTKSVDKRSSQLKNKEQKPSNTLTNFCEHELRERMAAVHAKLQHYLEERDELVRINHYTCGNAIVSYMTTTINKLLIEWNQLKTELEKY